MTDSTDLRCSIIVCTYNRAALLCEALTSLAAQMPLLDTRSEVVVVDNNSTDHTDDVLTSAANHLPLRHVRELEQGLSHARNRGVRESTGDLLVFTDDDVLLDPGWLQAYRDAAERYPDASYFGGRIHPHFIGGRPGWVRDESMPLLAGVFVCYDQGSEVRPYDPREDSPVGASFAVRRRLLEEIGVFEPRLGRSGNDVGRGEETHLFMRATAAGHRGVYVGTAFCRHQVEPQRLRVRTLYRYGLAKAQAERTLATSQSSGSVLGALGILARGCFQLLKGRGDRFRQCVIVAGIQMGLRR